MSRTALLAAILLLAVAPLAAQHHTAPWSFIGDANAASPYPVTIGRIDLQGVFTTVLPLGRLLQYDHGQGGALEADDQTYVVAILSKVNTGKLLRVDAGGTILQTVVILPVPPQAGGGYTHDVIVDQNGDYVVVVGPPTAAPKACLLRANRQGVIGTIFPGPGLGYATAVTTDIDSGHFLLLDTQMRDVYSIAPDGSAVTSVGNFSRQIYLLNQLTQDVASGDLFVGSWSQFGAVLLRMDSLGQSTIFLGWGLYGAYGVHTDRASDPCPRLVVGSTSVDSGLFFVDLATRAITTFYSSAVGFPLVYHKVFPNREVATERFAARGWNVRLHFAGEGGSAYTLALSLSGVRPGLFLPDGRRICFNPDAVTAPSVLGHLAAVFTGQSGRLDVGGRATARLDVSSLPPLAGLRVWIQALVLDPNAPLGIRTIPDPVVMVL
ncbi:MAG: hypothetical protein JXQ29_13275 [Planctomycetes bacterium]|nr:hypothetical protein [Planctomycetota bacterium]